MLDIHDYVLTAKEAEKSEWDAIVVGAGMGGGAAAYSLAQKGQKTLLVDLGKVVDLSVGHQSIIGELRGEDERKSAALWPHKIRTRVDGVYSDIWAPMGSGIGGTTLLYAAALQRLEKEDFEEQVLPSGEKISWPFSYSDLFEYYEKAEDLLRVRGTPNPLVNERNNLLEPPEMSEADKNYFESFQKSGLNPYRLHVGISYKEGCGECAGSLCPKECKRGALNSFIEPALATNNLYLLPMAQVVNINEINQSVESVELESGEHLKSKRFFLAAGALNTPKLLMSSKNDTGQSLAHGLPLVGKNLMFHAGHHIAFWPPKKSSREGPNKTLALRDYYIYKGKKMGEFQSTGLTAGYANILYAARFLLSQTRFRNVPLLSKLLIIPAFILSKLLGRASIFATIVEDFPYEENRVELDSSAPSGLRIEYTIHNELSERTYLMSELIRKRLKPLKSVPMNYKLHLNYGHPCGTCRTSKSSDSGVLDEDCKVFGISNLYVTDASFMPTSGGTNPSLTIAANALRVVDKVLKS